ncbi:MULTISPECIES: hypothetical protein [unclassified Actinopolyspora]|uniref:hypothetical protein n=1 Tax=unclassified Actinopolyspora TaxID=2639451 RepID=UPI0013F65D29|nr:MULTISPECIES: hypothetical protein [unclassified Actinopolyspora]NHD18854.1 hypothetical protein [Actinopolyspora sp. BKK2]NHE77277.1 hypothetical protein [Actinopolyspora sp. BKK1]
MEALSFVGSALLVLGGILWAVGAIARGSARSSAEHDLAVRLIPVEHETREVVTELLRRGNNVRAVSRLRRATGVPLTRARVLARSMAGGTVPPANHSESRELLRAQRPELVAETERVHEQHGRYAAIRHLRRHLPVGLAAGNQLVRGRHG